MLASFTTLDGYRGPQPGRAVSSHRGVSQMVPETETVRDRDRDRQRDRETERDRDRDRDRESVTCSSDPHRVRSIVEIHRGRAVERPAGFLRHNDLSI